MMELIQVFDYIERVIWDILIRNSTINARSIVDLNVKTIIWINVFFNIERNIWRNAQLDALNNIATDKQLSDAYSVIQELQ